MSPYYRRSKVRQRGGNNLLPMTRPAVVAESALNPGSQTSAVILSTKSRVFIAVLPGLTQSFIHLPV